MNKQKVLEKEAVIRSPLPDPRPPIAMVGATPLSVTEIVNRLEELVRFVLECELKPLHKEASFVDVYKQLVSMRDAIDTISRDQQAMVASLLSTGITQQQLEAALSPEDKKVIAKLRGLQGICESAKERLHAAIQRNPEAEKKIKEKIQAASTTKKQKVIQRKGKFRPLGGKEGWLPT